MKTERLPSRWRSSEPALRAVQVAFDVSETVMQAIRTAAFESNLSNSDQVRVVLGLPVVRQVKRPRLTVSLSGEDYQLLGSRYGLDASDHLAIKERVAQELFAFAESQSRSRTRKRAKTP
ncbi:hypothetical protein [Tahibacter amnicola]|uniref:Uncharacterized protein n=1 Tax=Tahibacter amnicola TaxID=2976241 RepID=A0ABY6BFH5_9GAMM|nr:hypothetical protein [Tahibacter amnicola]UXI68272.1 hypothetical protein N4264_01090 [Tahibacter amnicola]